jgi:hypothetical protein
LQRLQLAHQAEIDQVVTIFSAMPTYALVMLAGRPRYSSSVVRPFGMSDGQVELVSGSGAKKTDFLFRMV